MLDTSVIIALPTLTDASQLPVTPFICTVTLAELSVGPLVARSDDERAARQAVLRQAEADVDPLPFDAPAARAFGRVATALRQAGRKSRARSYDAMIAAVALARALPLHTANPDDFPTLPGLTVVPVAQHG
ncbi:type II toxin-antitoxin system VapC family toxin [Actinomycetospora sp. CA-084318]|uniref:type II toxin-antitoxin system VapC family toxin n=1 Tax=Actinomycetospora sp. CA-084318 TaxID=3239892 RepID=UPI003D9743E6